MLLVTNVSHAGQEFVARATMLAGRQAVSDIQHVLEALNSPIRREILWLIWDAELPVGEIAVRIGLAGPTISQHLSILRNAGLVTLTADKNFRRYRAQRSVLAELQARLFDEGTKWIPFHEQPRPGVAGVRRGAFLEVVADVACDCATAFASFSDSVRMSAWLGVPVSMDAVPGGSFAYTEPWGTRVRGTYVHLFRPTLLSFRWDFDATNVPVPGGEMTAYLTFSPAVHGCRLLVHQVIARTEHAHFVEVAWTHLLARLQAAFASDGIG